SVIDASGVRTDYAYDLKDRLVEVRRGGPVRERYEYDKGDQPIRKKNGAGEVLLELERDLQGRLVRRTLASGEAHQFKYDARNHLIEARTLKHKLTFAYDALGQRTADKRDGAGVERHFTGTELRRMSVLGFRTEYDTLPDGTIEITDPTGGVH